MLKRRVSIFLRRPRQADKSATAPGDHSRDDTASTAASAQTSGKKRGSLGQSLSALAARLSRRNAPPIEALEIEIEPPAADFRQTCVDGSGLHLELSRRYLETFRLAAEEVRYHSEARRGDLGTRAKWVKASRDRQQALRRRQHVIQLWRELWERYIEAGERWRQWVGERPLAEIAFETEAMSTRSTTTPPRGSPIPTTSDEAQADSDNTPTATIVASTTDGFRFLDLPAELRLMIYDFYFVPPSSSSKDHLVELSTLEDHLPYSALRRVSRQLRSETAAHLDSSHNAFWNEYAFHWEHEPDKRWPWSILGSPHIDHNRPDDELPIPARRLKRYNHSLYLFVRYRDMAESKCTMIRMVDEENGVSVVSTADFGERGMSPAQYYPEDRDALSWLKYRWAELRRKDL